MRRPKLAWLLKVLVMVALLVLLAWLVDVRTLIRTVASANAGILLVAVALALADRALMIAKWYPLLQVQVPSIPLWRAARAYLAAGFAAVLLPASLGGDVLRAVALGRRRAAVMEVSASIAAERLLGAVASGVPVLIALILAVHSAIPLGLLLPWALAALGLALAALVLPLSARVQRLVHGLLGVRRGGKWAAMLRRFVNAYAAYRSTPGTLALVGIASVLEQGMPILVAWMVSRSLDLGISLEMLLVAVPLTIFVARLPVSVAGLGVSEGAMVYILSLFGVPPVDALALSLTSRAPDIVSVLPGALFWHDLASVRRERGKAVPAGRAPEPGGALPASGSARLAAESPTDVPSSHRAT
ncbi:MAG TPA: lysylphosphatidylglycerol synthase transmembrane domain-containing protein [Gemmatimonadaceae bacterium]|nr:lysylphosphatidylglycerol synthase transmembrane domain-containing protein [Gemmatimonadaceae bacterium]